MMDKENRNDPGIVRRSRPTEFETREDGNDLIIEGYFIVFNQPYFVSPLEEEVIDPHALDNADVSDVRGLIDHVSHLVVGRNKANTLTFRVDDIGVFVIIRLNRADSDAMNLRARVQRGDVDQASFGMTEGEILYSELPDGRIRRTVKTIDKLWEFSVCTFPAYEQTSVGARSKDASATKETIRWMKEKVKRSLKHHA